MGIDKGKFVRLRSGIFYTLNKLAEAGHAQPSTTLAIYTQVYDRRRDEIRKQMSRELYK